MGDKRLLVACQPSADVFVFPSDFFQYGCVYEHSRAIRLSYGRVKSHATIQSTPCADNPVASKHAGLNELAAGQAHDERNDACIWQVHIVYEILCVVEDFTGGEF